MEHKFHNGQHVVCINDNWFCRKTGKPASDFGITTPRMNIVYTIRHIRVAKTALDDSPLVLLFEEINNLAIMPPGLEETGFVARHFKPLQKLTTDMFMKDIVNV